MEVKWLTRKWRRLAASSPHIWPLWPSSWASVYLVTHEYVLRWWSFWKILSGSEGLTVYSLPRRTKFLNSDPWALTFWLKKQKPIIRFTVKDLPVDDTSKYSSCNKMKSTLKWIQKEFSLCFFIITFSSRSRKLLMFLIKIRKFFYKNRNYFKAHLCSVKCHSALLPHEPASLPELRFDLMTSQLLQWTGTAVHSRGRAQSELLSYSMAEQVWIHREPEHITACATILFLLSLSCDLN